MDNRAIQVELDVEELHNRVSHLEKILTDLSKWTGFKGFLNQLLSGNLEPTSNDQTVDKNKGGLECPSSAGIFIVDSQFSYKQNLKHADQEVVAKVAALNTDLKGSQSGLKKYKEDLDWTGAVKKQRSTTSRNGTKCQKCQQRFSSLRGLKIHKATKHRTTKFTRQCLSCSDNPAFANAADLKKHIQLNHSTKLGRFSCPHCPKVCSCFENLQQHINVHFGRRPYKCSKCLYKSSWKNALDKHKMICRGRPDQIGNAPVKSKGAGQACPHCPKILASRQVLQWHINMHTGEKPYKCEFCFKAYAHKPNLLQHSKSCKEKESLITENPEEINVLSD